MMFCIETGSLRVKRLDFRVVGGAEGPGEGAEGCGRGQAACRGPNLSTLSRRFHEARGGEEGRAEGGGGGEDRYGREGEG